MKNYLRKCLPYIAGMALVISTNSITYANQYERWDTEKASREGLTAINLQ